MVEAGTPAKSDAPERIKALRLYLHLSRAAFAKELVVSPEIVTRWEKGTEYPPPNLYIKLGNMAGEPTCWYFWERAGLYSGDLMQVLPAVRLRIRKGKRPDLQIVHAGSGQHLFSKPQLHAIPLLPLKAATSGEEGDKRLDFDGVPPQGIIAAPSHWAPNPAFTSCLRVQGNSMAPVLLDGYIIVIDTSETALAQLVNKLVVAWQPEKGLTVSWLKIVDGSEALVSENAQYGPIVLDSKKGWRLIGRVIWWIGRDG